jgi:hypothetical protein
LARKKEKRGQFPVRAFVRRIDGKSTSETRRGFGWSLNTRRRRFYGPTTAGGLRSTLWRRNFSATHGHGEVFAFANEIQSVLRAAPIDADEVAAVDLLGGKEIGHREYDVTFNRTFEVTRSIALVGAFLKKELASGVGHAEKELAFGCL